MNNLKESKPYIEGEKTTIHGTEFFIGNHAIIKIAGFEKPLEGEVTGIGNHTIYLNGKMIQLNNCVKAEKVNLKIGIEKVDAIKKANFELGETNQIIQNSDKLVLEMILKHIENQIAINMDGVEKIASTLSETITYSTKAGISRAKIIVELLTEIDKLEGLIVMMNMRIEKFKAQKLANEIKGGE